MQETLDTVLQTIHLSSVLITLLLNHCTWEGGYNVSYNGHDSAAHWVEFLSCFALKLGTHFESVGL